MGILPAIDLALAILGKLNIGADTVVSFYHTVIRPANPDAPDLTDAEIIAKMKAGFTSERELSEQTLAVLRSGEAPAPAPAPEFRATGDNAGGVTPIKTAADFRAEKSDGAPAADRVGSPKPGTPAPFDPTGGEGTK